jgi:hypothetical protein
MSGLPANHWEVADRISVALGEMGETDGRAVGKTVDGITLIQEEERPAPIYWRYHVLLVHQGVPCRVVYEEHPDVGPKIIDWQPARAPYTLRMLIEALR